jgi:hypothetical protein
MTHSVNSILNLKSFFFLPEAAYLKTAHCQRKENLVTEAFKPCTAFDMILSRGIYFSGRAIVEHAAAIWKVKALGCD